MWYINYEPFKILMFVSIQVEAESGARLTILGKKEDDRRLLMVEGRPEARERARRMDTASDLVVSHEVLIYTIFYYKQYNSLSVNPSCCNY